MSRHSDLLGHEVESMALLQQSLEIRALTGTINCPDAMLVYDKLVKKEEEMCGTNNAGNSKGKSIVDQARRSKIRPTTSVSSPPPSRMKLSFAIFKCCKFYGPKKKAKDLNFEESEESRSKSGCWADVLEQGDLDLGATTVTSIQSSDVQSSMFSYDGSRWDSTTTELFQSG